MNGSRWFVCLICIPALSACEDTGKSPTPPAASIVLDSEITSDDTIIAAELTASISITGTTGGDVAEGDIVTLTVNSLTFTGEVAGGMFSIDVPGADLAADADTTIDASVTTTTGSAAGEATATDTEEYGVDIFAPTASITLAENITDDDVISIGESMGNVAISGAVGGDVADGDTITLTVNTMPFTGAALSGAFSINVPGSALADDSDMTIDASVTTSTGDPNGETTATTSESYSVDLSTPTAVVMIDGPIASDGVVNAAESAISVTITGTVSGDVADGDTVTLTVNNTPFTGAVSSGTFSIDVSGADLAADADLLVEAAVVGSANINGDALANDSESYSVDLIAPAAVITYPAANNLLDFDEIVVRGVASDAGGVSAVLVNGVLATTTDDFANWTATVPLATGTNALIVETNDDALNIDDEAFEVQVRSVSALLNTPTEITIDTANNRALITDNINNAVMAMELASGELTTLSDGTTPDSNNTFAQPFDIVVDDARGRALVADRGRRSIIAVDLTTGARTVLSGATTPDGTNPFSAPTNIELDSVNDRALVWDDTLDAIVAVDLLSGARTILSGDTVPDGVNPLDRLADLVLDPGNNRLLAAENTGDRIVAIDLTTGARTIVATSPTFSFLQGIELDAVNNRAFLLNSSPAAVFEVGLGDGSSTTLTNATTPNTELALRIPVAMTTESSTGRLLVLDDTLDAVIAVDTASGQRSPVSTQSIPDTGNIVDPSRRTRA